MKRQAVKALAEANEYLYNQLKEQGIAVKTIRSIATAFLDVSDEQTSFSRNPSDSYLRNTDTEQKQN